MQRRRDTPETCSRRRTHPFAASIVLLVLVPRDSAEGQPYRSPYAVNAYNWRMERFAASVREGRRQLGLDQAEFGRLIGVGQQAVSRWERDGSRPRRAMVVAVADLLGLPVDEMLAAAGYIGAVADSPHEVSPPVRPLARTLPFHELTPERFEDVCVEVLEHLHPGGHASRFGGPGERQDGIDVLLDGDPYATAQCKRH